MQVLAVFSVFAGFLAAQTTANFPSNLFRKPVKIFGDPEFIGTAGNPLLLASGGPNLVEGREFNGPQAVALDTTVSPPILYVADTGNHRVLAFQFPGQIKAGSQADLIIGQQDRFQNLSSAFLARTTQLTSPNGVAVDKSGNLYVADSGNNRILRYPRPFAQPPGYQIADLILGQKVFSGTAANQGKAAPAPDTLGLAVNGARTGMTFDPQGNLWVTDTGNNRVIRFGVGTLRGNPGNAPNADTVLGQIDLVGNTPPATNTSKVNLFQPIGLAFDLAGRLFVVDRANRVLVYPAGAGTNTNAIRILGIENQANPGTTQVSLSNPQSVAATGSGVVVADAGNNRLMIYPPLENWAQETTQFSPSATGVIGQQSFILNKVNQGAGDASASSLNFPRDVISAGAEVFVADSGNHRVLVFPSSPGGISGSASRVTGQLDFPYFAPNLIEGREFNFGNAGSLILDYSSAPPHLYVSDTSNNRILGFRDFTTMKNGQKADLVIGQPDFFRSMVNYPTNLATQPSAKNLNIPTSLAVDSVGNLFVADLGNSRVLRFPSPFNSGQTSLQSADLVIGQTSFTSAVTDATERTMSQPFGVALTADAFNDSIKDGGWLVVSDATHNRVLFFQKPFVSGMAATKVLGQLNFSTTASSADPQRFNSPRGIAVDPQDRVLVVDGINNRLQIFTKAANLANYATPSISIPLNGPSSVAMSPAGSFWATEANASRISHFPPVDLLGLKGLNPDGAVFAQVPRTAFADGFGNLLVGDGANRILYFAPQVDIVNAANYSLRPLAPGTIAALFPHSQATTTGGGTGTSNPPNSVLAGGTEAATATPLPTTLADIQVIVNGTAAPLFFASPGQINMALSNTLPGGGTVDLQVVKASTGQIYGGAEVGLATADPALFTLTTTGGGQILASNFADGTINSPQNPVQKGQFIILYGTGLGYVPNAPPDGFTASGQPASELPQILIGSTTNGTAAYVPPENITFSGLAPTFVGLWQINVQIPTTAPSGSSIPIIVLQASVPSIDPTSTTAVATTIAIK